MPTSKIMESTKLGECKPKLMDGKKTKDVPAQRVLKIEDPVPSKESIEEMTRRMERKLDEIMADNIIKLATAPTTAKSSPTTATTEEHTEDPAASEEYIEEMVRQVEHELDEEI